ncbi:TPA: Bro-N domain-containing protein, partial [Clostridioides difficile]|nr:Bro-N domain-containing protein [Clostridioides difficile]
MLKILQEKNVKVMWSKNGEEVWFNANDVGEELGIVNIRDTLRNIDREYKKKFNESTVGDSYTRNFKDKLPNFGTTFVAEEAVYNMSFRSNKPEAKLFTKWVTKTLKQIRIHGYYIA